jgi:cytoskeletal protein CcmA (bactofilin family)
MFSKQDKKPVPGKTPAPSPATVDQARRSPKVASVISEDMTIQGHLLSEGEIHIDGKIVGDVKVARLTLGETGLIEGSVTAEAVEIRGKVVGPITAKVVRLFASCHVEGDITHEQLAMETGAHFQGRSMKLQRPNAAALPLPAGVVSLTPSPVQAASAV